MSGGESRFRRECRDLWGNLRADDTELRRLAWRFVAAVVFLAWTVVAGAYAIYVEYW